MSAYLLTGDEVEAIRRALRWIRSFSLTGPGVSLRKTADSFSAYIAPPAGRRAADPAPLLPSQFKVTTAGLATCQAKTWDGTTLGADAVTITNIQGHALNDILYALPVSNVPGMWLESPSWSPSATQYLMLQVTDATGHIGIAAPKYR